MSYSRKAQAPQSESNIDYKAFNEHLVEVIGNKMESRVAVISGICDLGRQPRANFEERYDATKPDHIKALKDRGAEVKENVEFYEKNQKTRGDLISIPQNPNDQIALYVSFPECMVNYGKFFDDSGEDRFEPYTTILMGTYWDKNLGEKGKMLAKGIGLSCTKNDKSPSGWAYSPLNTISKLALNCVRADGAAVYSGTVVDQDFDIGELLGGVCTYSLSAEINDKGYFNEKVKDCAPKHKMIPVPDETVAIFGLSYGGGNDDDSIARAMKFATVRNTLEQGEGWATSKLKEEVDAFFKKKGGNAGGSASASASASASSAASKADEEDEFDDFDADGMFDS